MLAGLLERGEVVEELELRSPFGVMAIHGGGLERTTDVVARAVADLSGSSYYGVLFGDDVAADAHVPSTAFVPAASESLAAFFDRVDTVVSVHGYGRRHLRYSVLLGGRNRALAGHVADTLGPRLIDYDFVTNLDRIPRGLRGQHARNPVNRPALAGVQIELPPTIRWCWTERGWSDAPGVGRAPQLSDLISGLADAIGSWGA